MQKIKKLRPSKKIIIITLALLIVLACGAYYVKPKDNERPATEIASDDGINYSPATETEKEETERHKQDLQRRLDESQSSASNTSSKQADVTMTYLYFENGKVHSAGIINNVFEDGGACTLILTKGSLKVAGNSFGLSDVNKTTCPPISIDRSSLSQSGEWTAVLSYGSSSASGSSSTRIINVP